MTPQEIRAEAITRLRTALAPVSGDYCCEEHSDPDRPYVEGDVDLGQLVDALGDMLPVSVQETVALDRSAGERPTFRRYLGAWRKVSE